MPDIQIVIVVSILAGSSTGLGAIPIFLADRISHRFYDGMIALAGGIMIGASMFTLIIPGLEIGSIAKVITGIIAGGSFLLLLEREIPHVHQRFNGRPLTDFQKKAYLIGGSITLHNLPEGLAVGIAFGSGLEGVGLAVATAIAIQNIPDGFAFAIPAEKTGLKKWKNITLTTLSGGAPEPIAAVIGFLLVNIFKEIFPLAAGFAAGAMLAVVSKEMIPESHGHGYQSFATFMFLIGFALMMFIDKTFTV